MAKFNKKKSGDLPAISTASLPDIVFMLLFFFMVATVMRDSTLMVQNTLPAADQIQKLDKKDRVIYIYAGKPSSRYVDTYGTQARIQLNDKFGSVEEVGAFVLAAFVLVAFELAALIPLSFADLGIQNLFANFFDLNKSYHLIALVYLENHL